MRTLKYLLIPLILIFIGLQSCNSGVGVSGFWRNENIDAEIRSEINELDKKIIQAVVENDASTIKGLMSEELKGKGGKNIDSLIEQMSNAFKNTEYRILDQYYAKNTTTGLANTVISDGKGENNYIVSYQALNKEMVVSLIIPKNEINEILISTIYGKYPDGWKLNILQFGVYKINGKTAPELFQLAKDNYQKGYIVDAANNMFLASQALNPANKFWKYQKEDEIKSFHGKLQTEIKNNFQFPVTLSNISSEPQIFNIFPFNMNEGVFPMIEYYSSISLGDTIALKAENDKIQQEIGKVFKGIDKDKKFLFYKAYNEMPNGITPVKTYGFVKELQNF